MFKPILNVMEVVDIIKKQHKNTSHPNVQFPFRPRMDSFGKLVEANGRKIHQTNCWKRSDHRSYTSARSERPTGALCRARLSVSEHQHLVVPTRTGWDSPGSRQFWDFRRQLLIPKNSSKLGHPDWSTSSGNASQLRLCTWVDLIGPRSVRRYFPQWTTVVRILGVADCFLGSSYMHVYIQSSNII